MSKGKIGLLPMYIALYDESSPGIRPQIEEFYSKIADEFGKRGVEVETTEVCRLEKEFEESIRKFEKAGVDAIVTLHLAYSPSLESSKALSSTKIPVLVLDTTPDYEFGPDQDESKIMFNHGIHGVQDMCNLMIRNDKPFQIEAGHWANSDVIDRVCGWINAAYMANVMKNMRVGIIGQPFKGMGDFAVDSEQLRSTIGIDTVECKPDAIEKLIQSISDNEMEEEIIKDRERFIVNNVDEKAHLCSLKAGLAVRKWIKKEGLGAFTFNFLSLGKKSGLPTVPFLEASKELGEGCGYAGEGDVITAALVGAIASVYKDTTFTEMFCPGWKENLIYLSHMGEINVSLTGEKPVLKKIPFRYTDAEEPVIAVGRYKKGEAVLVNLAPGKDNSYTLIVVPVMMKDTGRQDNMKETVRGWFEPPIPVPDFLSQYSRIGGTHHSALVYGDVKDEIMKFGEIMGWNIKVIG